MRQLCHWTANEEMDLLLEQEIHELRRLGAFQALGIRQVSAFPLVHVTGTETLIIFNVYEC